MIHHILFMTCIGADYITTGWRVGLMADNAHVAGSALILGTSVTASSQNVTLEHLDS